MAVKIACELYWPKDAVEINTEFDKTNDRYKLNVTNISEKAKAFLENSENGVKVKTNDNYKLFITPKSKYPYRFVDLNGNEVPVSSIGNGSKAVVEFKGSYSHKLSKQWGNGPIIDSVVTVTEIVSYASKVDASNIDEQL